MQEKHLSFSQVLDIYGFRVIVKDVPACYLALGALHSLYKPVPGKFKDYIAIAKVNGYQSLHTTLIGPYGMPVEIQIRTQAMNRIAEAGVASHWLYKSDAEINEVQQRTHKWLQSLLDIQHASGDPAEFLEHIKIDLFPDEVYVFTPQGKIMAMPRGATAVDFAYAVHTDIGNRCAAARINYELAPLRTELKNGDRVEIITAAHANPNPAWLSYVKTGKARSQIRHFLKTMQYEEAAALGERMLNQAVRALGAKSSEATPERWDRLVRDLGAKSRQEVFADIGLGKRLAAIVARKLLTLAEGDQPDARALGGSIVIHGSEGLAVQLARCCNPIPGDPIIGFIKKGQGLVVHTHDCPTAAKSRGDPDKWLDVEWAPQTEKMFDVGIRVTVVNQRGVLAKVATAIAGRFQHRQRQHGRGAQPVHHHAFHAAGRQPPAPCQGAARPAARARSRAHRPREGLIGLGLAGEQPLRPVERPPERSLNQPEAERRADAVRDHVGDVEGAVAGHPLQVLDRDPHRRERESDAELTRPAPEKHREPERHAPVGDEVRDLVAPLLQVDIQRDERQHEDREHHAPSEQQPGTAVRLRGRIQLHGIQWSGSSQTTSPTATGAPATRVGAGPSFVILTDTCRAFSFRTCVSASVETAFADPTMDSWHTLVPGLDSASMAAFVARKRAIIMGVARPATPSSFQGPA